MSAQLFPFPFWNALKTFPLLNPIFLITQKEQNMPKKTIMTRTRTRTAIQKERGNNNKEQSYWVATTVVLSSLWQIGPTHSRVHQRQSHPFVRETERLQHIWLFAIIVLLHIAHGLNKQQQGKHTKNPTTANSHHISLNCQEQPHHI